ncbi:hypothetical protein ACS0TY_026927 [Phlomoides rotata]
MFDPEKMSTPNTFTSGYDESLSDELKELLRSLPREKGWYTDIFEYQGFWYDPRNLQTLFNAQENFHAQDSDVFVASFPKSGTTWMKAIVFTLLNRERYPVSDNNHPLIARSPHDLVHYLEHLLPVDSNILDASTSIPRLFSTHMSYSFLPESVKNNRTCKLVYVCRNPGDAFVSFWYFSNRLRPRKMGPSSIEELFELFCKGVCPFGPFWDNVIGYWEQSKRNPDMVFFVLYEDLIEKPAFHLRRLAEFLNCPFSANEEESGMVEKIMKFCSFDHLSNLEVNKRKREFGEENNKVYFRKGKVGDYKNHLSTQMIERLDRITQEKLFGSGLVL